MMCVTISLTSHKSGTNSCNDAAELGKIFDVLNRLGPSRITYKKASPKSTVAKLLSDAPGQ